MLEVDSDHVRDDFKDQIDIETGKQLTEDEWEQKATDNSNVFLLSSSTKKLIYVRQFTLIDIEESVKTLEFRHSEDELGNGLLEVFVNGVMCQTYQLTII